MPETNPSVVVIAGPNGAGKSTAAPYLLREHLGIQEFVNADAIAAGLSGFRPESAAMDAGRIMLARLRNLAAARQSFAFETTLSSRTFAPWLRSLVAVGYQVRVEYLWLPSAETAVHRVARRVELGGHSIPPADIRRRYPRSINNLFELYMPLCHRWRIYDTSGDFDPDLIAEGAGERVHLVRVPDVWRTIQSIGNAP